MTAPATERPGNPGSTPDIPNPAPQPGPTQPSATLPVPQPLATGRGYPRPLLRRRSWVNLNGTWDFAIDREGRLREPAQVNWDRKIEVPYSPETQRSGVGDTGFYRAVWYKRTFPTPEMPEGHRVILHFGAVDYRAKIWVNGQKVVRHEGGYTPFRVDITQFLNRTGELNEVAVRADDDPHDLAKPRGKQDWQLEPHSIWYPRTTGIWQTVWMEVVPPTYVIYLRWTPVVERWEIGFEAYLGGEGGEGWRLDVTLRASGNIIAQDSYRVIAREVHRRIALSDPGIDDYRNELLWHPSTPNLIDADIALRDPSGKIVDAVRSYTALRSIGVQGDKFVLNGRPYYLRMILDQGYWPQSGLTSPGEEETRRDVELIKAMGFNGVRRHQKISDPRFLYWADVIGLLVWEEMPSPYRFTRASVERLTREWMEVIRRDISHPCIIAWVPFNESWGVPDLPDSPAQRHCVQSLYHLTKTLDPTRPVIGNDGWESVATDIIGIHDYDDSAERIARRYGSDEMSRLFKRERPGGRLLVVGEMPKSDQPIILTEFGGIALPKEGDAVAWGYSRAKDAREFAERYSKLLAAVRLASSLAGFCYTQFTDTYQEANGLLYADRTPKMPIEQIAEATGGAQAMRDRQQEAAWRQRMMNVQRDQYLVPAEDYRMSSDARP